MTVLMLSFNVFLANPYFRVFVVSSKYLIVLIVVCLVLASLIITNYLRYSYSRSLSTSSPQTNTSLSTSSVNTTKVGSIVSKESSRKVRKVVSNLTIPPSEVSPYSLLNYPIITYGEGLGNGEYQAYYVVDFRLGSHSRSFRLGVLKLPVIDLVSAYNLGVDALPRVSGFSGYDLVSAYFEGGEVVNGTLVKPPTWSLTIARTYCGFRVWGSDYVVVVNAMNSTVIKVYPGNYPLIPKGINCSYFRINYPKVVSRDSVIKYAKYLVLHSNFSNVIKEVVKEGYVGKVDLRIVKVGPESRNLLTEEALKKEFIGKWFLAWVITFYKLPYRVSLLIDASSGELINLIKGPLYPPTPYYTFELHLSTPLSRVTLPTYVRLVNGSIIKTNLTIKAVITEPGSEGYLRVIGKWVVHGTSPFSNFSGFRRNVTVCFIKQLNYLSTIKVVPKVKCVRASEGINTELIMDLRYYVGKDVGKGIHVILLKFKEEVSGYSWEEVIAVPFIVSKNEIMELE